MGSITIHRKKRGEPQSETLPIDNLVEVDWLLNPIRMESPYRGHLLVNVRQRRIKIYPGWRFVARLIQWVKKPVSTGEVFLGGALVGLLIASILRFLGAGM